MKKTLLAVLAVFVTWSILDFILHGLILGPTYATSPELWRPVAHMKTGILLFTVLIKASAFVSIYVRFIAEKGIGSAVPYGLVFGIGIGTGMGYGTYAVMPIPSFMAFAWFGGSVVEAVAGGLITGLIIKTEPGQARKGF